jgi:hypothetical protein
MPLHHISVVIEPGLHIHFRGLFSSITPHVAAAVIPPSDMSSKTSSGVPIVVILATLVLVLVTVVALCRTLASVRCDGHHKMVGLLPGTSMAIGRHGFNKQIFGVTEQVRERGQSD